MDRSPISLDRNHLLTELCDEFGVEKVTPLIEASELWLKQSPNGTDTDWSRSMISQALGKLNEDETYWTFIATRIYLQKIYSRRGSHVYANFESHVNQLVEFGFYDSVLVEKYSQEELQTMAKLIAPERDKLFTYVGIQTMMNNFIVLNTDNEPVELPQERWLVIAMTLMQNETEKRVKKVAEAYWALSHLYLTFEAPSLPNMGKQYEKRTITYLDVYHKDIFKFLDSPSLNTIEKSNEIVSHKGVCIPDLFMERVESRGYWHLFDPQEVYSVMGYFLEDFYDEKKGSGSFRKKYMACVNHPELQRETVFAVDLMKRILRSQLETGLPHLFYTDEANRKHVNKHKGRIYPTTIDVAQSNGTQSSINLGRAVPAGVLERLIPIQVRMLDNAIDLKLEPDTINAQYRGISLGTMGWHHLLALKKIRWESTEAVAFADELYEKISYLTISASMALAQEKGAYPLFTGSDWHTGAYFEDRKYNSRAWQKLRANVSINGVRNGYMTAVTSNSSTANLAGSTIGIEPIIEKSTVEQHTNGAIPVIVPDLTPETFWFYKSGYYIDQQWTLKQNAARQRHIDQCISLNMYVQNTIQAAELLELHLNAWKSGLKMTNAIYLNSDFPSLLIPVV